MKRIAVVGTGYVGLTTGACFAELGNGVVCVDIDAAKIARLRRGEVPFFEPGLGEMVARNLAAGRLSFTTDYAAAIPEAEIVFIAVATPTAAAGRADLRYVRTAAQTIGAQLCGHTIIVNKSTVPIGTGDWVGTILRRTAPAEATFAVVSNPEFLAEGSAVSDFLAPDRVVLGGDDRAAAEAVAGLYLSLEAPIIITDLRTAEMIKYASNAMLATRVSFINEIAAICECLGADVREVAKGMGYDKRKGKSVTSGRLAFVACFVYALGRRVVVPGRSFQIPGGMGHAQLARQVMDCHSTDRRDRDRPAGGRGPHGPHPYRSRGTAGELRRSRHVSHRATRLAPGRRRARTRGCADARGGRCDGGAGGRVAGLAVTRHAAHPGVHRLRRRDDDDGLVRGPPHPGGTAALRPSARRPAAASDGCDQRNRPLCAGPQPSA